MLPDDILGRQEEWQHDNERADRRELDEETFLYLTLLESAFLIPIAEVSEISEMLLVRPYPTVIEGHIGVVSLRGKVIPVVSMSRFGGSNAWKPSSRLVIINARDELFAIIADTVKKTSLRTSGTGEIISLDKKPVRILSAEQILNAWQTAEGAKNDCA